MYSVYSVGRETAQNDKGLAQLQRMGEEAVGYSGQEKRCVEWH